MVGSDFKVEVDNVDKDSWTGILRNFDDGSIYQTWSYGAIRRGEEKLSHLVLKKGDEIVAAAQSWVIKLPLIGRGIAYVKWGPMWQLRGRVPAPEIFHQIIQSLKEEYVVRRGLLLRVLPNQIGENTEAMYSLLEAEEFKKQPPVLLYRTLIVDLSSSLNDLYKSCRRQWRENLNRARKNELKVIEGTGNHLFEVVLYSYNQMRSRKKFADFLPVRDFQAIQEDLPDDLRMHIMVCKFADEPIATRVTSHMGNAAITLISTTGIRGLDLNASFLLQWRMVEWLKSNGCRWYDLCGINPEMNPGLYQFKSGLCQKNAMDVFFWEFEVSQNLMSTVVVISGQKLRAGYRKLKQLVANLHRRIS